MQVLDHDDPRLLRARLQAQASFDWFTDLIIDNPDIPGEDKQIKVRFPVPSAENGFESLWLEDPVVLSDGHFTGLLDNVTVHLPAQRIGDRVEFTRDQVADWCFTDRDGQVYGHFVNRVMMENGVLPSELEEFSKALAPQPIPPHIR